MGTVIQLDWGHAGTKSWPKRSNIRCPHGGHSQVRWVALVFENSGWVSEAISSKLCDLQRCNQCAGKGGTNGHLLSNSCRTWNIWTWLMKSAGTPPSVLVRHAVSGKWPFSCSLHFWRNERNENAGEAGTGTTALASLASSPSMLPSVPVKKAWRLTQPVLSVGRCQDKRQKSLTCLTCVMLSFLCDQ